MKSSFLHPGHPAHHALFYVLKCQLWYYDFILGPIASPSLSSSTPSLRAFSAPIHHATPTASVPHSWALIIKRLTPVAGRALGCNESLHWRKRKVRPGSGGEINQNEHNSTQSSTQSRGAAQRLWFWKLHSGERKSRESWSGLIKTAEAEAARETWQEGSGQQSQPQLDGCFPIWCFFSFRLKFKIIFTDFFLTFKQLLFLKKNADINPGTLAHCHFPPLLQ